MAAAPASAKEISRRDCSSFSSAMARLLEPSRRARGAQPRRHIAILRGPRRPAKHKIVALDERMRVIEPRRFGLGKGKKRPPGTRSVNGRCFEADEENFSFVNNSPRRLWSRRAGIEAARRIAVVSPTPCDRVKETGRYARTLKRDPGGASRRSLAALAVSSKAGAEMFGGPKSAGSAFCRRTAGSPTTCSGSTTGILLPMTVAICLLVLGVHCLYRVAVQRNRQSRALAADA